MRTVFPSCSTNDFLTAAHPSTPYVFRLMNITKCDADIYLGDTVIGEASGNWRAKSFTITLGGRQAGKVLRKTGLMGRVMDKDSYVIEIEQGVDVAFMCMVVIALDEIYHDDKE